MTQNIIYLKRKQQFYYGAFFLGNLILSLFLLIFGIIVAFFYIQKNDFQPSQTSFIVLMEIIIIFSCLYLYIMTSEKKPQFDYEIRNDGFIYPYDLKIKTNNNNFIPYTEIKSIHFINWGLSCSIVLKNNSSVNISFYHDEPGYIALMKKLYVLFPSVLKPNLEIIEKYYDANDNIELQKAYTRQLKDLNKDFN